MKYSQILGLAVALGLGTAGLALTGCEDDSAVEDAGENINDAVDDAGDALDDAGDAVDEAVEDLDG